MKRSILIAAFVFLTLIYQATTLPSGHQQYSPQISSEPVLKVEKVSNTSRVIQIHYSEQQNPKFNAVKIKSSLPLAVFHELFKLKFCTPLLPSLSELHVQMILLP
jgi:hypothetical protein